MSNNKTVLVTGASSGLGEQFCRALAADGYTVVAAARRLDKLDTLCTEITAAGGKAVALELDVTNIDSLPGAIDKAEAQAGPIDCLVNNAGGSISKKAVDMTPEDFDFVMSLNLRAPYFLCTEFARRWIERGTAGRIVNVGSLSADRAIPGHTVYGTSKSAIHRLTQQFAREWINKNICVNAIAPGYIRTDLNSDYFDSPQGQGLISSFPRRRIGSPEDLDKAIVFLCEPNQSLLTGQILSVDDGQGL